MSQLFWVHDECLAVALESKAHCFFIDDTKFFVKRGWSFKRYLFLMRMVEDLGINVMRGDTLTLMAETRKSMIQTIKARDPELLKLQNASGKLMKIDFIESNAMIKGIQLKKPVRFMKFYYKNEALFKSLITYKS